MFKEIKYLIFILIISLFIFFVCKYYFSDENKKKSFRSLNNIDQKIDFYAKGLNILKDDTQNIIEYKKEIETKKKKKYFFWDLINKND